MTIALHDIPHLMRGSALGKQQEAQAEASWSLEELAGRLIELRGTGPSTALSFAARLVLDAQQRHEPAAWICGTESLFFPADLEPGGVLLEALPVVRMTDPQSAAVAADKLVRSGAFGLLLLDLGPDPWFPDALQKRLAHHAEAQHTAIICLTEERQDARQLGSVVSLRVEATRNADRRCILRATRDRQRRPGWSIEEEHHGTLGMR